MQSYVNNLTLPYPLFAVVTQDRSSFAMERTELTTTRAVALEAARFYLRIHFFLFPLSSTPLPTVLEIHALSLFLFLCLLASEKSCHVDVELLISNFYAKDVEMSGNAQ
ncbi:hypothetical protein TNCT_461171 [Trichonephila clavata]|uniref:Uncharacterized protein n=1 Tax=Trichonephila clavata TaxID=2740835 RepID=A0A8X6LK30_TRICU|nr:hypothetical protein TNCT_461171 [Trichonephila clavata]